jgi:hypothetical protein
MRRGTLFAVLAGLVVVAAATFALRPEPHARDMREEFRRINVGMTVAEVEAILGPPGDYRSEPTIVDDLAPINQTSTFGTAGVRGDPQYWSFDTALATVYFDESGRAIKGLSIPLRFADDNSLVVIRRWIKRAWQLIG